MIALLALTGFELVSAECVAVEVAAIEAIGKVVVQDTKTHKTYVHIIDNCESHEDIKGHYVENVNYESTTNATYSFTSPLSATFKNTSSTLRINFNEGVDLYEVYNPDYNADIKDVREVVSTALKFSRKSPNDGTTVNTKKHDRVIAVGKGFRYTVRAGSKMKIVGETQVAVGTVQWKGIAQCTDKDGIVLSTQPVTGKYTGTTNLKDMSQVEVMEQECPKYTTAAPAPSHVCDLVFAPAGSCLACAMEPYVVDKEKGEEALQWVCSEGEVCTEGSHDCGCVAPFAESGHGGCLAPLPDN